MRGAEEQIQVEYSMTGHRLRSGALEGGDPYTGMVRKGRSLTDKVKGPRME